MGRPVVGCAVRILDQNGGPLPEVTGRVFVGGDLTFDAYTSGDTKDAADMMDTGAATSTGRDGCSSWPGRRHDCLRW